VGYHRTDKARKKNSAVADHVTHTHRSHMAVSQPRGVSFIYSRLPSAVQPPKAGFTSCLALPPRQLPPHPPTHKAQTQPRPDMLLEALELPTPPQHQSSHVLRVVPEEGIGKNESLVERV